MKRSDIRRLARRLLGGRTVPGHSTPTRLSVVERVMLLRRPCEHDAEVQHRHRTHHSRKTRRSHGAILRPGHPPTFGVISLYFHGGQKPRLAVAFPARAWDAGSETVAPIGAAGLRGFDGSASASWITSPPTPLVPVTSVTSTVSRGFRPRPSVTEPLGVTGRGLDDSLVFPAVTEVTDIQGASTPGQYAFHSGSNASCLYPLRMSPPASRTVFGVTWKGLSSLASPCGESGLPFS